METSFGELFTKEKQHHKESYSSRRPKKRKEEERRGKKRYDELPSTVTWSQQCWLSMGAIKDQNLWHHKDPNEIFVRDLNSKRYFSLPGLVKRICLQPQVTIQASSAIWSSLFSCSVSLLRHQRSQLEQVECREEFPSTILRQQNKFDCREKEAFL